MGNKDRVKQRTRKGKKRRFSSNQYSRKTVIKTPTADPASASGAHTATTQLNTSGTSRSASKVETIPETPNKLKETLSGYRIIDLEIIVNFVSMLCCPECYADRTLSLNENHKEKKGFASYLVCRCSNCSYEYTFYTSNPCGQTFV